ncbi:conserved hypothetical protein [Leishmania major strain Friedlin]|uniref:Tyrosine specific protein phosphatases domain-containing protein n=1 Tax=Leishmania major TaxID=5664 RepID=Q4QHW9_LEIMA|nr:conserved hypothetical protein [Leishmania major strain Friedlin]CAG9569670.1 Dual_specificity_phosphatase-__catalytic_domain_containing_protein_-__putative [Leishmania major strain Friedlin]CAJ02572.1 conserved hypothetical protein [Leishmania major strain Friedlin]|eukprot:XP_001681229.1 conserved hypothetical protein [Leishmania major strain Friedlin]
MKPTDAGTDNNTHAASVFDWAEREMRLVVSLEDFLHAWAEGDREGGRAKAASSSAAIEAAVAREDERQHHPGAHPNPILCASGLDAASLATARIASAPSTSTLANEYLAALPPRLPAPPPRSFRPNEMMPGVYLGSWSDIGTDILELARRLRSVSTGSHKSSLCTAPHSWQRLVLLVRACPVKGLVAPRLELRVTRRREGVRRLCPSTEKVSPAPSTKAAAARLLQPPSQRPPAMHSRKRPGAATTAVPADEDVVVAHMSLSEVYKRVCAAVSTTTADTVSDASVICAEATASSKDEGYYHSGSITGASPSTTPSGVSRVARWLCPDSPLISPSRSASPASSTAADVPSGCTLADWHVFVRAMQGVLLEEAPAHTPAGAALSNEEIAETTEADHGPCSATVAELRYWRLTLPILDSPGTRLLHYTPMTSLIMRAALTLEENPQGRAWLQGQQQRRELVSNNAPAGSSHAMVDVASEGGACGEVGACGTEARVFPCAAVHCQAGKSRSVTFVAAFLMQEWMWWYRGCSPPNTAGAGTSTAEQQKEQRGRQGSIARRLVDTVLSYLRRRRLCIDINLGFDTQLWEMMCGFVRGL